MRRPSHVDRLDSNDRKKIRRIFLQMAGIYMPLVVIAIGGVAARSIFSVWPDTHLSQKANLR